MRERALLLGVGLGGEDDVGVLAHGLGQHRLVRDHGLRGAERRLPQRAVRDACAAGRRAAGRACERSPSARPCGDLGGAAGRARRASRSRRRGRGRSRPRAARGRSCSAGISSRPAPARPARPRRDARLSSARAAVVAAGAGEQPLAVDDHDVLAARQRLGEALTASALSRRRSRRRRGRPSPSAASSATSSAAPPPGAMRSTASARASSAVGRALATATRDAVAAHALADAQVEDRRVVDRVALEQHDGVGELEVGDASPAAPGSASARATSSGSSPPGREARWPEPRPSRNSCASRNASSLVVSPAGQRGGAAAGLLERAAGGVERLLPARGHQLVALAHERLR